ncbi:MAG TPA: HNH endonuclease signature motif containing protein [Lacipirellulaceae bacterium]|nr:HNH endonuclease signature motif containing protein [Lacipirellulaceae bacterium]
MDAKQFLVDFQDYLAPLLDTYEQVIYLYVVRRCRLLGHRVAVVGFKSARKKMALGKGPSKTTMSEGVCYEKLKSLAAKKCVEIVGTEHTGTRVAPKLPAEIPGLIPTVSAETTLNLEDEDFFTLPEQRARILERESGQCFYCLCQLNADNYVIEHVMSRPSGDGSYRNVVEACRRCNNRKGEMTAVDFLRLLLREARLSDPEFEDRCSMLEKLKRGELKPPLKPPHGGCT